MFNKSILVVVESGFAARNLLRSDFLGLLKKDFKKVVVCVPSRRVNYYRALYQRDNVVVEKMREKASSKLEQKFYTLLNFSIPTREARIQLMRNLFDANGLKISSWFVYFLPIIVSWYLSRFKFWRSFLRRFYCLIGPDKECLALLKEHRIDVLYANYSILSETYFNLKLFKAAKKLGILIIGNIASWDNLYSKVFITQHTDFLTVQNKIIKEDVVKIGDFKEEQIKIVGIPQFDFYSKKELLLAKEEFFRKIGAAMQKKLIVFAAGSKNAKINYRHFLDYFAEIAEHKIPNIQFYLRPHPKYSFFDSLDSESRGKFKGNPVFIFEQREEGTVGKNFEFPESDSQLLLNLLHHADLLVCLFSTFLIEGSLAQIPIISLAYGGGRAPNYYYRVERGLDLEHIRSILKRNFCKIAKNDKELLDYMKEYLENPRLDAKERKATAQEQMFITDGTSGAVLVRTIREIVEEKIILW